MKLRQTVIASSAVAAGTLLALAVPLSASAHVSVDPSSTAAGSYSVLTFALPHGCDGSATTAIAIDLPEGIESVTPTVNYGWDVSKVAVDLATPLDDGHGNTITTRIGQIVYTAKTPLADGLRDTFALNVKLPADAEGQTLEFPVLQTCEVGETVWNESPKADGSEPDHPAPAITVTAATADAHGHGAETVVTDAHSEEAGSDTAAGSDDVVARILSIGGLVAALAALVVAIVGRRKTSA